jgi:hypothetical protein
MNRLSGVAGSRSTALAVAALSLALAGCVAGAESDDEDTGATEVAVKTKAGLNGGACALSDYNCKLRTKGGNRIAHLNGDLDWGITPGATLLDGNGDPLGVEDGKTLKFNYGQKRSFGGQPYVFALTTSNHSSGWFPLASVISSDVVAARIGDATAHRSGLKPMSCYAVKNASDAALESKKVVYDSTSAPGPSGEAAGDYLPKLRANGKRSINLIYNMPGSGLGGPAIDHFPEGTKFQRLEVTTYNGGPPSIDVKLWSLDGKKHFKTPAGTMKFVYGYVVSKTGETRVGWMAYDALSVAKACP